MCVLLLPISFINTFFMTIQLMLNEFNSTFWHKTLFSSWIFISVLLFVVESSVHEQILLIIMLLYALHWIQVLDNVFMKNIVMKWAHTYVYNIMIVSYFKSKTCSIISKPTLNREWFIFKCKYDHTWRGIQQSI